MDLGTGGLHLPFPIYSVALMTGTAKGSDRVK